MTTSKRRLDRIEGTLAPPQTLEALCARAAAAHNLDTGSVLAEARRILARGDGRAGLRAEAEQIAALAGRPVEDILAEVAAIEKELAA